MELLDSTITYARALEQTRRLRQDMHAACSSASSCRMANKHSILVLHACSPPVVIGRPWKAHMQPNIRFPNPIPPSSIAPPSPAWTQSSGAHRQPNVAATSFLVRVNLFSETGSLTWSVYMNDFLHKVRSLDIICMAVQKLPSSWFSKQQSLIQITFGLSKRIGL
jgi:hypothetical protein